LRPPPRVIRLAWRSLRQRPSVTLACVLVVAMAIGASTAIFSFINATLLRPLPFPGAERMAFVWSLDKTGEPTSVSYPDYLDWRSRSRTFESLAAFYETDLTWSQTERPERVPSEMVAESYFAAMGVLPLLGRGFGPAEAVTGGPPAAILGYSLWRDRFGSDPRVLGTAVKLGHTSFTVIGVMPDGFRGVTGKAMLWVSIATFDKLNPSLAQYGFLTTRNIRFLRVVGRMRGDRFLAQAQSEMEAIRNQLAATFPESNTGIGIRVVPLRKQLVGETRSALLVLLAAVGVLLLIACLNVANLLLARAAERSQEIAIRVALGASRGNLTWQLLTESVIVGLLGGGLGLLLAAWGVRLLPGLIPVELPSFVEVTVDARVLAFGLLTSMLTGVAFGLAPALGASRTSVTGALKEGGASLGPARHGGRLRAALVVAELALAAVLLVGAGLLFKTLLNLRRVPLGFDPRGLLTLHFNLADAEVADDQRQVIWNRLLDDVRALPAVESAALSTDTFFGGGVGVEVTVEGRIPRGPEDRTRAFRHTVSPRFFASLGIPLRSGRDFAAQDDAAAPGVVIVSRAAAARWWPGRPPLGKRLKLGRARAKGPWLSVIGVVGDVRYRSLVEDPSAHPDVYLAMRQDSVGMLSLLVRSRLPAASLVPTLRGGLRRIAPEAPVYSVATLEELVSEQTAKSRFTALLMGAFSLFAMVLAMLGVYGLMAYLTAQRGHEIGLRMALGAARANVLAMVLRQGLGLVLLGTAIGLVGALGLTRILASLLYDVAATDPATFAGVFAILALTALLACLLPAHRASRIDPAATLRGA
jgi:predicted permease